jgi:hypothetical protein
MKRGLILLGILIIFPFFTSCDGAPYTAEQREEIKQVMVVKIMAELTKRMQDILPKIQEELAKAFQARAEELGLAPDKADEFIRVLNSFLEDSLNAIINKKAEPAVEAVVEKVLPAPAKPSGTWGKILATLLGIAAQAGMASIKKG